MKIILRNIWKLVELNNFTEDWRNFDYGFISLGKQVDLPQTYKFYFCPRNSKSKLIFDEKNMQVLLINEVKVCANLISEDKELEEIYAFYVHFGS